MNLADLAIPAALAAWAWLAREKDEAPPVTPSRGWPKADVPLTPPEVPPAGARPMTPVERRLSHDEPPTTAERAYDRMTPAERERVRQAYGGDPGTPPAADAPWRPARKVSPAEVARAKALLAPGVWHVGLIEESGGAQYRGAWHPSRGGGQHKGVEVWRRGG